MMRKIFARFITVLVAAFMCTGIFTVYAETAEQTGGWTAQYGWVEDQYGKWYLNPDGTFPVSGWAFIDNDWYYFSDYGYVQTGWLWDNGWYYLNPDGAMATGWVFDENSWYYMGDNGIMVTGWVMISSDWYYLNPDGAMVTGWVMIGSDWYFFDSSGKLQTGWISDGVNWGFLDRTGRMQPVWLGINGFKFYMEKSEMMVSETTKVIDGVVYEFDGNRHLINESALEEDLSMPGGEPGEEEPSEPGAVTVYDGITLTEDIAEYMKNLVSSITTETMSREEKLWTVFMYIRDNYPHILKS